LSLKILEKIFCNLKKFNILCIAIRYKDNNKMRAIMTTKCHNSTTGKRSYTTAIIARAHNVSPDYVRKVIRGDRKNAAIKASYKKMIEHNRKLLKALKKG
jgi:hypothetical protein